MPFQIKKIKKEGRRHSKIKILIWKLKGIFFPPPKSEYFFGNIGNQNIFLEKKHNPPFKLNGPSLMEQWRHQTREEVNDPYWCVHQINASNNVFKFHVCFCQVLVNGNLKKEALIDNCETSRLRRRPCLKVDGVSNFLSIDFFLTFS
jgi:hypothetical protein